MSGRAPGGENRRFLIFAAVLVLVTIAVIVMLRPGDSETAVDDGRPDASDDRSSIDPLPPGTTKKKKKAKVAVAESTELPDGFGTNFPGLGSQPGIGGEGQNNPAEKHKVTIRWSSSKSLGVVAYIVPTSTENSRGSHIEQSSTWSTSTTAYGRPDYAVAFAQAGPDGKPVTCEVLIDGRVTDRRSTQGPYGTVWCQG